MTPSLSMMMKLLPPAHLLKPQLETHPTDCSLHLCSELNMLLRLRPWRRSEDSFGSFRDLTLLLLWPKCEGFICK